MTDFFNQNIIIVFFFYGLSFFSMGFAILLELRYSSESDFARDLLPLAGFGLLHGGHEWLEMFLIIHGPADTPWISRLRLCLLMFSFLLLVAYGANLVIVSRKRGYVWGIIGILMSLWIVGVITIDYSIPDNSDAAVTADVFTRYLLAIPGSVLTFWGLLKQRRIFFQKNMRPCGRDIALAAMAFGLYGVVGQIFTSRSSLFPSLYLNTDIFLEWFGFPIQVLRAILACIIAIGIIRSLRSIRVETSRQLEALRAAQVAEKKHSEELRAELLHRTVQAQEGERFRIARELHDETGQTLTALGLGLRGLTETIPSNPQRAIEHARELESLASSGIGELQRLVMGLHPPHLEDLGLLAAVKWYAGEISQRYHIPVDIHSQGEKPKITSETRIALFRIVQEAITNSIRHANASQISIRLDYQPEQIFLCISDDGKGFDVDQVLSQKINGQPAWGLLGILERASLINSSCNISSRPGQGTSIKVTVPIHMENTNE